MRFISSRRFLTIYSGVLTAIFTVTILAGFAGPTKKTAFDEISVQRINIVEPDGTLCVSGDLGAHLGAKASAREMSLSWLRN